MSYISLFLSFPGRLWDVKQGFLRKQQLNVLALVNKMYKWRSVWKAALIQREEGGADRGVLCKHIYTHKHFYNNTTTPLIFNVIGRKTDQKKLWK